MKRNKRNKINKRNTYLLRHINRFVFGNLNEIKLTGKNALYKQTLLNKICSYIYSLNDEKELKNRLNKFLKSFSIIDIYNTLDRYILDYKLIKFLLEFYKERTNGNLYYFKINDLSHKNKFNILNVYFKNSKESDIEKLFLHYVKNFTQIYKIIIENDIKLSDDFYKEVVTHFMYNDYNNKNITFLYNKDLTKQYVYDYIKGNSVIIFTDINHNVFFRKNFEILKFIKKVYEDNNNYKEFIKCIIEYFDSMHLHNIFNALNIPRKHFYIVGKVAPKGFFSKRNSDNNLNIFV